MSGSNLNLTIRPSAAAATIAAGASPAGTAQKTGGADFSGLLQNAVKPAKTADTLDNIFQEASEKYNVPENLLKAVAKAESGFQADAVSSAGAQGIMQLMPSTAKALGVTDSFDPEQNVMGGAKYLGDLLRRYGDPKLALAAYNAGSGNVKKYGGIPPFEETRNYIQKVMGYAGEDVSLPQAIPFSGGSDSSGSVPFSGNGLGLSTPASFDFSFDDYRAFLQMFLQMFEQETAAGVSGQAAAGETSDPAM